MHVACSNAYNFHQLMYKAITKKQHSDLTGIHSIILIWMLALMKPEAFGGYLNHVPGILPKCCRPDHKK